MAAPTILDYYSAVHYLMGRLPIRGSLHLIRDLEDDSDQTQLVFMNEPTPGIQEFYGQVPDNPLSYRLLEIYNTSDHLIDDMVEFVNALPAPTRAVRVEQGYRRTPNHPDTDGKVPGVKNYVDVDGNYIPSSIIFERAALIGLAKLGFRVVPAANANNANFSPTLIEYMDLCNFVGVQTSLLPRFTRVGDPIRINASKWERLLKANHCYETNKLAQVNFVPLEMYLHKRIAMADTEDHPVLESNLRSLLALEEVVKPHYRESEPVEEFWPGYIEYQGQPGWSNWQVLVVKGPEHPVFDQVVARRVSVNALKPDLVAIPVHSSGLHNALITGLLLANAPCMYHQVIYRALEHGLAEPPIGLAVVGVPALGIPVLVRTLFSEHNLAELIRAHVLRPDGKYLLVAKNSAGAYEPRYLDSMAQLRTATRGYRMAARIMGRDPNAEIQTWTPEGQIYIEEELRLGTTTRRTIRDNPALLAAARTEGTLPAELLAAVEKSPELLS